jgi:hypothetical protein
MRYSKNKRNELRVIIADLEEALAWLKNDTFNNPPKQFHWHLNFFVGATNELIKLATPKG